VIVANLANLANLATLEYPEYRGCLAQLVSLSYPFRIRLGPTICINLLAFFLRKIYIFLFFGIKFMTATVYNYSGYDLVIKDNPILLVPQNVGTVFYNSTHTNTGPHLFLGDKDMGGIGAGNKNPSGDYYDSHIGYTTGTESWAALGDASLDSGKFFIYKDGKSSVVTRYSEIKPGLYIVTSADYPPPVDKDLAEPKSAEPTSYWYMVLLIVIIIAIIAVIAAGGYWYKKKYVI
jgi:hypothetical protein